MSRIVSLSVIGGLLLAVLVGVSVANNSAAKAEPQLGHMVFFTLKDRTEENRTKLVDLCNKFLNGHDGTLYYSAGSLADDLKRDVNDREFDVALHLVFKDKASYEVYATAPRHLEFIDQGKAMWAKVRVFDSYVTAPEPAKK